jgi:GNAT superfamily N-acetyltransferase
MAAMKPWSSTLMPMRAASASTFPDLEDVPGTPLTIRHGETSDEWATPENGWSLVAEQDGLVVGVACVSALSSYDLDVELHVEDSYHGRGIGTALLHDVAVEASARLYRSIHCLNQSGKVLVIPLPRMPGDLRLPAQRVP